MRSMTKFLRDTRGAGMVEYIILVGVIAIFALVAFQKFGKSVQGKVQEQGETVEGQVPGSSGGGQ
jgi:Flp pilus assembly pilin Flp